MLARGEPLSEVLRSFLGDCSAGRAALGTWLSYLATLPTVHVRRAVLEHFLRTFEAAQHHGAQWRVVGPGGFTGKQHLPAEREQLDPMTGEITPGQSYPRTPAKRHCPKRSAGGIAARSGKSPRTCNRYRAALRDGGLIGSTQPNATASDAVLPRSGDGRWAYAQHWLRFPPTPEMLRRWRGRRRQPPVRPTAPKSHTTFSPARPPRADDLRALGALAEREN